METAMMPKNKKKKTFKIISIILATIVIVPLVILTIFYNTNDKFKVTANKFLVKMPGTVGNHFETLPTEGERQEKINYLSKYYTTLDSDIAADKIYIIKTEDEKLYVQLIRSMNSVSVGKTEEIILKVRNMELRKDLLFSVYEDAQLDENQKFMLEVERFKKQDIIDALSEVERKYGNKEFLQVLNEVDNTILGNILYYTDPDITEYILNTFNPVKKVEVKGIIETKYNSIKKLIDIAQINENKEINLAVESIGNKNTYSIDELATIYSNLSTLKSAKILSQVSEQTFIEELFNSIMKESQLTKSEDNITVDISNAMEFLNEYNFKIKDLVAIYEKMTVSKVAKIVENMIDNTTTVTSLELNSEETYDLSDRKVILDVLAKMKTKTASAVLDNMEPQKASEVTRLLVNPQL